MPQPRVNKSLSFTVPEERKIAAFLSRHNRKFSEFTREAIWTHMARVERQAKKEAESGGS